MAKKKKQEFAMVIWQSSLSENSSLIIYNLTDNTMEGMYLDTKSPVIKINTQYSASHSWGTFQRLREANNGTSVTVLDHWWE